MIDLRTKIEQLQQKHNNYGLLLDECEIINRFVCILAKVDCTQAEIDNFDKASLYSAIDTVKSMLEIEDVTELDCKSFLKVWVNSFMVYR